jgi:polyhydroxyalkanoate synthesis regulator phasin
MSDTKDSNTKKRMPAEKGIVKGKTSSQQVPEQETIETPRAPAEIKKEKGLLGEVVENIGEDAKMVGEKATELADILVDKLKKGFSHAYEAGAKVVDDLSQTAQEYAEKYKAESEIKKLEGKKDKLITQLGQSVFKHHLAGGRFAESFFKKKEVIDQFNEIEMLDKKIIETGKQLDKGKE